ncbi:hypothetical protein PYCC9005_004792 [Savitreella phatthalungensis]
MEQTSAEDDDLVRERATRWRTALRTALPPFVLPALLASTAIDGVTSDKAADDDVYARSARLDAADEAFDHLVSRISTTLPHVPLELASTLDLTQHEQSAVGRSLTAWLVDGVDQDDLPSEVGGSLVPAAEIGYITSLVVDAYTALLPTDDDGDTADHDDQDGMEQKRARTCTLCTRQTPTTFHHLIPKTTHAYFLDRPALLLPLPKRFPGMQTIATEPPKATDGGENDAAPSAKRSSSGLRGESESGKRRRDRKLKKQAVAQTKRDLEILQQQRKRYQAGNSSQPIIDRLGNIILSADDPASSTTTATTTEDELQPFSSDDDDALPQDKQAIKAKSARDLSPEEYARQCSLVTRSGLGKYGMAVCRGCHSMIHRLERDERRLGRLYNTRRKLLQELEGLREYVDWASTQRPPVSNNLRHRR